MFLLIGLFFFVLSSPAFSAVCATAGEGGALILSATPVGECSGYVILDSTDWLGSSVWTIPTVEDIALVWSSAFVLPVTLYLITWAIGRIVNLFR